MEDVGLLPTDTAAIFPEQLSFCAAVGESRGTASSTAQDGASQASGRCPSIWEWENWEMVGRLVRNLPPVLRERRFVWCRFQSNSRRTKAFLWSTSLETMRGSLLPLSRC